MTGLYGLIGHPLDHSLSAEFFASKFRRENIKGCEYRLFPIKSPGELKSLLIEQPLLRGLNVTIPFKRTILDELDEIHPDARMIGAVNCIRITHEKNRIITTGYNSDAPAFEKSFIPLLGNHHGKALVLGTGGSALAVCHILQKSGIPYLMVSRKANAGRISYDDINQEIMEEHLIVINTTPLGMAPHHHTYPPIPYHYLTEEHLLYDLVYNPPNTAFMSRGKASGAQIYNGYEMLCLQAEMSWAIWQA